MSQDILWHLQTNLRWALLLAVIGCAHQDSYIRPGPARTSTFVADELRVQCAASEATACVTLGQMDARGDLGEEFIDGAERHYSRACDLGSADGCGLLAGVRWDESSPSHSIEQALALDEQACAQGRASSRIRAGEKLLENASLRSSEGEAATLLERGCDLGIEFGCTLAAYAKAPDGEAPKGPGTRGCLTQDKVLSAIGSVRGLVRDCYERELSRNEELCGTIRTKLVIEPDGSVLFVGRRKVSTRVGPGNRGGDLCEAEGCAAPDALP